MRLDGDPVWEHDQECTLGHPCARCEQEEEERVLDEEEDRYWSQVEQDRAVDREREREREEEEREPWEP